MSRGAVRQSTTCQPPKRWEANLVIPPPYLTTPQTGLIEKGKKNRQGPLFRETRADLVSGMSERSTPGRNR